MRYKKLLTLVTFGLLLIQTGFAKVNVVTSLTDLASITKTIGGDRVEVTSIAAGFQDPHFVDAKPSYIIKLQRADMFVEIGLELEIGWVPQLLLGSRNQKIQSGASGFIDASKNIHLLEIPTGKIDRSMGDIHPFGNPHYWLDPLNGIVIAENITDGLKRIDPANAGFYDANLAKFKTKIYVALFGQILVDKIGGDKLTELAVSDKLDSFLQETKLTGELGGWLKQIEPCKGMKIITYHNSWPYFANRFGLNIAGHVEPKPGIPPSPRQIIELIKLINQDKIKLIIMEPYFDKKVPELIARKTGAKVLVLPPSVEGEKSVTDYITLFNYNLNTICSALKPISGKVQE
jgi:ABC-type Zn uptake system ZnuABC Zn-binding protein ZnuA